MTPQNDCNSSGEVQTSRKQLCNGTAAFSVSGGSETPVHAGEDGGRRHGEAGIDLVVLREEVIGTQGSPELAPYTYGGVCVPEDKVLPLSRCGRRSQDGVQTVDILHGRAHAETVVVVEQGDVQGIRNCISKIETISCFVKSVPNILDVSITLNPASIICIWFLYTPT